MNAKENISRIKDRCKTGYDSAARLFQPVAAFCTVHIFPLQLLLALAYRLSLDILYLTTLQPTFAYSGFLADFQFPVYGISLLVLLIFLPFVLRIQESGEPSSLILTFLNYIYFIPLTSFYGCGGSNLTFLLIGLVYWAFLLLFQCQIPVLSLMPLSTHHNRNIYLIITLFASAFILFISGRYTGFRFTLNIRDVYGIRAEAVSYNIPGVFSYLLSMMGIVLAIVLLYWLTRKKYWVAAALVVVYLFLYSISAMKTLFFFLILLLAGYYLYRPWMLRWLGGLLLLLAAAAVLEKKLVGSIYLTAYIFDRCIFLVTQLSMQYMEFFQDNPISLFRDSILGKLPLISSMYTSDIAKVIGEFRNHIGQNANNGLLGDMFANLPTLLGVLLLPLILIIVLRLLDAVARKLPVKVIIACCVYYAIIFSNGSWSTALLSNGYLIACIMFYFFPKEEKRPS